MGTGENDDSIERNRPTAVRTARRAQVLYAVSTRAVIESETDKEFARSCRANLIDWAQTNQLIQECEPQEHELLIADVGSLSERQVIHNSWNFECAAVLCWALQKLDLPPLDKQVSDVAVGNAVVDGLADIEGLSLRDVETLDAFEGVMYNLHWRVRDFAHFGRPYNMARMLANYPTVPGVPLLRYIADDIAVGDLPLFQASKKDAGILHSIVNNKRHAATWLTGDAELFSEVSLDT